MRAVPTKTVKFTAGNMNRRDIIGDIHNIAMIYQSLSLVELQRAPTCRSRISPVLVGSQLYCG